MRTAEVTRNTKETQIRVKLNLDGKGTARLSTGLPFLEHMLDQVARHGMLDLDIEAKGDLHIDAHHTVEDIGITLGQALAKAIGDKAGVRRFGHALRAARRGAVARGARLLRAARLEYHVKFTRADRRVRRGSGARVLPGLRQPRPGHPAHRQPARRQRAPQCETMFKAFARALRMAAEPDPRAAACPPPRDAPRLKIAVVDYGMGNLRSVSKALEHVAPMPRWF